MVVKKKRRIAVVELELNLKSSGGKKEKENCGGGIRVEFKE